MINPYSTPPASIPGSSTTTTTTTPSPSPTTVCSLTDNFLWIAWSVWIPIPYVGAKDCDALYKAIEKGVAMSNWQCVEKEQDIQLWFNSPDAENENYGTHIDIGIQSHYPGLTSNCAATWLLEYPSGPG